MTEPTVCAVMLTKDRPEFAARALRCFRAQTYKNKLLVIVNSGKSLPFPAFPLHLCTSPKSIGLLRNQANAEVRADIMLHFDDDDWSHPKRIEEQVALLQATGKECVGYRDMLFWREPEAWLYSNADPRYCLGTSLCYWRSVWEREPFADLPKAKGGTGEDTDFIKRVQSLGVGSWGRVTIAQRAKLECEPRMVATIHGGNSSYYGDDLLRNSNSWQRVSQWDARLKAIMEAA